MVRQWATWILAVMAVLFLGAYPFRDQFWWGLLCHMAGAGLIGGLADWYAVTALFGKPLGISYKTAIIPRSKERLIQMARHMVANELLRKSYLYGVIKGEHVPLRILDYLNSESGQEKINTIFREVHQQVVPHVNGKALQGELEQVLRQGAKEWQAWPMVANLGHTLLERERAQVIWTYGNRLVQQLLMSSVLRPYLVDVMAHMMERYQETSFWREVALALGNDHFTPQYIVSLIQQKGVQYLQSQESLDSSLGQFLWTKAHGLVQELEQNTTWQQYIEQKKEEWIDANEIQLSLGSEVQWGELLEKGKSMIRQWAASVAEDEGKQRTFERVILRQVAAVLPHIRPFVDTTVVKELSAYSPEAMTSLIREKLDYDLQMIRMNGSFMGAVLGGLFYLLAWGWQIASTQGLWPTISAMWGGDL